jgi:hypothetical protein
MRPGDGQERGQPPCGLAAPARHLPVGEPDDPVSGERQTLIAFAVGVERGTCAVEGEAVRLDDQGRAGPVEVDEEPGDDRVRRSMCSMMLSTIRGRWLPARSRSVRAGVVTGTPACTARSFSASVPVRCSWILRRSGTRRFVPSC